MQRLRNLIPTLFTLGNLFLGFLSVAASMRGEFQMAGWLIVLAGCFDAIDGKIARWARASSQFGAELDSLCDAVSFGIAPSMLIYSAYHNQWMGLSSGTNWLIMILAFLPSLAGALRLARFNVMMQGATGHKTNFTGLPIPASAATIATFMVFSETVVESQAMAQWLPVVIIVVSYLMVSRLHYDAMPRLSIKDSGIPKWKLAIFYGLILGVALFPAQVFFPGMILYIISGLLKTLTDYYSSARNSG